MNKAEYDKLEILEQVNFINDKLKLEDTLKIVCEKIGIGRTTVRDRLTKQGYLYNKDLKQYIKNSEYKHTTDVLQVAAPSITKKKYKSNTSVFDNQEIKNKILSIIDKHDNIEEMLSWYNKQKNIIEIDLNELKIDKDKLIGETKVTTIRVNIEVWEQFKIFIGIYPEFKSMDLISMALVEYMHRYKK